MTDPLTDLAGVSGRDGEVDQQQRPGNWRSSCGWLSSWGYNKPDPVGARTSRAMSLDGVVVASLMTRV